MTLAEICEQYKGKWVLIEYHELDRNLEVVEGDVIAEAPTKEQIYGKLLTVGRTKNTAIRYCGEWPTDIAMTVLDRSFEGAAVVAHDLPSSVPVDGLLGMDLLVALRARIDVNNGTMEVG